MAVKAGLCLVMGILLSISGQFVDVAYSSDLDRLLNEGEEAENAAAYSDAISRWKEGLELAKKAGDKRSIGNFSKKLSSVHINVNQYLEAMKYGEDALLFLKEAMDRKGEGACLNILGIIQHKLGRYEKALELFLKAQPIYKEIEDAKGESDVLNNMGSVYDDLGQYEKVMECYDRALSLKSVIGDRLGMAETYGNEGLAYNTLGRHDKALESFEKSLAIGRDIKDRKTESAALSNIGLVHNGLGQYAKTLEYCGKALEIKREIGDRLGETMDLAIIGGVNASQGEYERALEYFGEALEIARAIGYRRGEANHLANIGNIYLELGRNEKAMEHYEKALSIHREIKNRYAEGAVLGNMGAANWNRGRYEEAQECFETALGIHREIGDPNGEGGDLTNLGNLYASIGEPLKAMEFYKKALDIYRKTGNRKARASVLTGMGMTFRDSAMHDGALVFFNDALELQSEIGYRKGEGENLANMGMTYGDLGQNEKALGFFNRAKAVFGETGDQRGEGMVFGHIGKTYASLGRKESARKSMLKGLSLSLEVGNPESVWRMQSGLGEMAEKEGSYKEAISYYDQALDTIESIRAGLTREEIKASFMRDKLLVYDRLIELLRALHVKDPAGGYDRKSFEIFERKQGRIFLEQVGRSGARRFAGLPEETRKRESDLDDQLSGLRTSLSSERSKPSSKRSPDSARTLEERIEQVKRARHALLDELKTNYPNYYALKYPKPATLRDLQERVLAANELILIYAVLEKSTCLWVIGRNDFGLFSIESGEEEIERRAGKLTRGIEVMQEAVRKREAGYRLSRISASSMREITTCGRELYGLLVPPGARPILSKAGALYIVPTGPLSALPFEALTVINTDNASQPHFLVEDHPVTYLSSASLLKNLREARAEKKEKAKYPLLAFAHPVYAPGQSRNAFIVTPEAIALLQSSHASDSGGGSSVQTMQARAYQEIAGGSFPELPETEDEASEIARILEAPEESRPLQLRENASRSNVFRIDKEGLLDRYRYILFACHGIAPDNPLIQPALVLSIPDPKTRRTEFLTMADVFGLKLNADLVTLSACKTGIGRIQSGEGIVGLTRAFMYAGACAASVTLWSVESSSAKLMSTGLYANLKAGKTLAEALRKAKLAMIGGEKGDIYRHPFYWAPLIAFGDGR